MRIDPQTYRAYDQLLALPEGRALIESLEKDFHNAIDRMMVVSGEELVCEKGRASYIRELLQRFSEAKNLKTPKADR